MIRNFITIILLLLTTFSFSQNGFVSGTLTEELDGKEVSMPFANVFFEGTTIGCTSDFDGNFNLSAPAGDYVLVTSFLGYETFKKPIVIVAENEFALSIKMKAERIAIESVNIIAKVNRESEMALIMEQKNTALAVEAIGAKELAVKGVSDAAGAVSKITSITKQEGTGALNVRGLGDRYNTTTLNKLPLPSNDPEVKNIDLALFNTDVISHISIDKTYSASLYGDFGGANIDITSKRLSGKSFFMLSAKIAQNSSVIGLSEFKRIDGSGNAGFYSEDLPDVSSIRERSTYDFSNSWDPTSENVLQDIGFGVSGGKTFNTKKGDLSTFFTGSFDNEKQYTERVDRIISATGVPLTDMNGEEFRYETQSNAMLNLNYSLKNSELYFNSMLLNSSEENLISLQGNIRDVGESAFCRRSEFNRNMVLVNQLLGEHDFKDGFSLDWGIAYNTVWNKVPDRRQNQFMSYNSNTNMGEFDTEPAGANFRYFHEFSENEIAANVSVQKVLSEDKDGNYKHKLSFGYSGKYKNRQFNSYQFNHDIDEENYVNIDNVDSYINEENYLNDEFKIVIVEPRDENGDAKDGEEYTGLVASNSLFGQWEWNINSRLLLLTGLRAEMVYQQITTRANQITGKGINVETEKFDDLKVLPSISLKYAIRGNQNIRFATSKTYTLPQLQEMPLMSFSSVSEEKFGNPYLTPSEVYNIDIKWEIFPKDGLLSASVFGKYIINPINQTTLAGTQNSYFVANTGGWAYVYGFELDTKKDLCETGTEKLFAAANLSLMTSEMELDGQKIRDETDNYLNANFNDDRSALQGAAPLLANLSLGYSYGWADKNSLSVVVVYNYTSDHLYAIGQTQRGNEYERAINTLDFVLKSKFGKIGIDFIAKNLLNAEYVREQENRVEESANHVIKKYKKGVSYSLSLKYKF